MKKIFAIVIVVLFITTIAKAQDGWVTKKIDEKVSVRFPGEPKEVDGGVFLFIGKDSTIYISMVVKEKLPDEIRLEEVDF